MLQRLELVGFKSFADKTRFDFAPGVTAVVGPNGSGKSNIVDAVRWILGEQSAKSLRGGEMADVIFNGSPSRRSLGLAEVTMTFDNARRTLNSDATEVRITRRVYRDGTGEYLINGQDARLKDIKDLFLGSGAGTNAYCIIEQGRVDALLSASNSDRRVIFEEAAGVSRFKAKKIETLRKLTHVEQNLTRIHDVYGEIEKNLNRVRLEASKALKYQEFTTRLQEMRVDLGLREHHRVAQEWAAASAERDALTAAIDEAQRAAAEDEAGAKEAESALAAAEADARDAESTLAACQERLSSAAAVTASERQRADEARAERATLGKRLWELGRERIRLAGDRAAFQARVDESHLELANRQESADTLSEALSNLRRRLDELRQQVEVDRVAHMDSVRAETQAANEAANAGRQIEERAARRDRHKRRYDQVIGERRSLDVVLQDLTQTGATLQDQLLRTRQSLTEQAQRRVELRRQSEALQQFLNELQVERSALQSRIDVLDQLEKSQEGLGSGVKDVLGWLAAEGTPDGPVLGLVGDLLNVPRSVAPLVELALGERGAACFVVRDRAEFDVLLTERLPDLSGRVAFLALAGHPAPAPPTPEGATPLATAVGVVDGAPESLPAQLLGRTFLVDDRAAAYRALDRLGPVAGLRLITRAGEVLEADGTLTVGQSHAEMGVLSRKSELRDLKGRMAALEQRIRRGADNLASLRDQTSSLETPIRTLQQEIESLSQEAGDLSTQLALRRTRRDDLAAEVALLGQDLSQLEADLKQLEDGRAQAQARATDANRRVLVLTARLEQTDKSIRRYEQEAQQTEAEHTEAQVALAQVREQLAALQQRLKQVERESAQQRQEADATTTRRDAAAARLSASVCRQLEATDARARAFADKQSAEARHAGSSASARTLRERRKLLSERAAHARSALSERTAARHKHELRLNELAAARQQQADRLREDYQLDLAELYEQHRDAVAARAAEPFDPAAVLTEIAAVRRKVQTLGNVNLESLAELQEAETRAKDLKDQITDLTDSRRQLHEIIEQINVNSKKMFEETFNTIRASFQELFRKLFGGGQADIVMEDPANVLETGIEITARPPGKELRSISLMSGGEKTMTAIGLLMAIFRTKPSPFCLLDEVDAALDEANTARLANVIREFMDRSQFIVITHKKRTMAAADVLYGITMQESGVSKQVSVKFEDWPEDGAQSAAA